MPAGTAATDNLWEALYTQRAIRYFKPEPVPDEMIRKCVEAATRAPSGSNLQPWAFVAVKDAATRARIAARIRELFLSNEQMKEYVESGRTSGDPMRRRMMTGVSNIVSHLDSAPVFMFPCLYDPASPARQGLLAGSSIYPAVQNLLLAARGLGLGSVMTTFQAGMVDELREWLGLPENAMPVALIPIGFPDAKFGPVTRRPVDEVLHWDRWRS
ncbi:MAG: nitroreductase family protein [Tepidiformaceae bacterium]